MSQEEKNSAIQNKIFVKSGTKSRPVPNSWLIIDQSDE